MEQEWKLNVLLLWFYVDMYYYYELRFVIFRKDLRKTFER